MNKYSIPLSAIRNNSSSPSGVFQTAFSRAETTRILSTNERKRPMFPERLTSISPVTTAGQVLPSTRPLPARRDTTFIIPARPRSLSKTAESSTGNGRATIARLPSKKPDKLFTPGTNPEYLILKNKLNIFDEILYNLSLIVTIPFSPDCIKEKYTVCAPVNYLLPLCNCYPATASKQSFRIQQ